MPVLATFGGTSLRNYGLQAGAALVGDFDSIATQTVGSGGTSFVEFTSIPQTYTHLQIRFIARDNRATYGSDDMKVQPNNQTTAAYYTNHRMYSTGATSGSENYPTSSGITGFLGGVPSATGSSTNVFGAGVIDILDYRNTNKFKTFRSLSGVDNNSSSANTVGAILYLTGLFLDTTAISSIKISTGNATLWSQYSSFALYGVNV
jgi:hypothetical protein